VKKPICSGKIVLSVEGEGGQREGGLRMYSACYRKWASRRGARIGVSESYCQPTQGGTASAQDKPNEGDVGWTRLGIR